MLEDVIETVENCRYCLMCRHVAPVEQITFRESHSPHGWALLIASVRRGLLTWNEETIDTLYSAPDGGNSRAWCVTDQPLPAAIAAARAGVAQEGLAPAAAYAVRDALEAWGNTYKEEQPAGVKGVSGTALFAGDAAAYLRPETLHAAQTVLSAIGVEPVVLGVGRNNGFFASSLGFPETAEALARANLADLAESAANRMLVLSPGDRYTFGQLYPERLGVEWPEGVALLEVTSFLAAELDAGRLNLAPLSETPPYAYVDPTHAVREPQRHDAPRKLLEAVMPEPPRELFWRRERAHPAGNTALQFTQPAIAEGLTRARLQDAKNTGAELLICDDPDTLHALSQFAGEYGLRVRGLYELLAERLRGGDETGDRGAY